MNTINFKNTQLVSLNSILINTTFVLSLFPFFKVLPFLSAETQPVASIFAVLYLWLCKKPKNFRRIYLVVLPYLLIITIYAIVGFPLALVGDLSLARVIESLLIFLAPLTIFIAFIAQPSLLSVQAFQFSTYCWFLVCFTQNYFSGLLDSLHITSLLTTLIPRFSSESLAAWNRGVVGLAPEPSYSAHIILLLFTLNIFFYRTGKLSKKKYALILVMIAFMIYANQSATVGLIFVLFGIAYLTAEVLRFDKNFIKRIAFVTLILISFLALPSLFPDLLNLRFFEVLRSLFSTLLLDGNNINILQLTNSFGSIRSISVFVGYANIFQTSGFGSGMGGWGTAFLDALENTGINSSEILFFSQQLGEAVNIKPYAYASLVAFDLGLFGLISLSVIFLILIREKLRVSKNFSSYAWACLASVLFGIYFNSVTSLPTYWIMFALILHDPLYRSRGLRRSGIENSNDIQLDVQEIYTT